MISHFNSARAGYGASYLLITILAAVLGGVNPYGGLGKVSGLVIALFILQVASSGLNLLGVSTHFTKALWGIILVFVIGLRNIKFKNNIKN
jgi:ribose/xylose/arabinose/galactoside ABC-type transport system permease subunit